MKISIGDIHGKNCWKKYINEPFDDLYFVGDYFDTFDDISASQQIDNFLEICDYANKNSKVHLCLGNHDYHYLKGISPYTHYSGFQRFYKVDIQEALENNMDLIKPVHQNGNYLISHAGITKTFLHNVLKLENPLDINTRFEENRTCLEFNGYNQYGDDITQGCIWVRPTSLLNDCLDNYKQIVGHTHFNDITTIDNITFIDCLDSIDKVFYFDN